MVFLNSDIAQDYSNNPYLYNRELQELNNNVSKECFDKDLPKTTLNSWEDKNTIDKLNTCDFVEQQEIYNKWIYLFQMFDSSFKQKDSLFSNISTATIYDDFTKSLKNILSFSPKVISVGVSDDECAYIYFEKDRKSVYFDLFFESDQKTEVSLTIFENKESQISHIDYLDNSIEKLKKEFVIENELSYSPFAKI